MKKILVSMGVLLFAVSAQASKVIEGRLEKKLHGDLESSILGVGCVDFVSFFDPVKNAEIPMVIFERRSDIQNCTSAQDFEGEEYDIDFSKLASIKDKKVIHAIRQLNSAPRYFYFLKTQRDVSVVKLNKIECRLIEDFDDWSVEIQLNKGTLTFFDNDHWSDLRKTGQFATRGPRSEINYIFDGVDSLSPEMGLNFTYQSRSNRGVLTIHSPAGYQSYQMNCQIGSLRP